MSNQAAGIVFAGQSRAAVDESRHIGALTRACLRILTLALSGGLCLDAAAGAALVQAAQIERLPTYSSAPQEADKPEIGETRAKAIGGTRAKAIGGTRAKAIGGTRAKAIGGTRAKAIGGTRAKAIGGTRAKAIGGTRAKAIGGTRAKAIGGTRAKAIGGTRAKAIGGTRAKAIGGTRAKAIGGTRAKSIGGTRAKAIGGTRAKAIGGTRAKSIGFSYTASIFPDGEAEHTSVMTDGSLISDQSQQKTRPADRVTWDGISYDWLVAGPASLHRSSQQISVLGVSADLPMDALAAIQDAVVAGEVIAVLGFADSSAVTVVRTGVPFVPGSTEIALVGQIREIDSGGLVQLFNGVAIETTNSVTYGSTDLSVGDWISARGVLYPES